MEHRSPRDVASDGSPASREAADRALFEALRRREPRALDQLANEMGAAIARTAFGCLGNHQDAGDLAQETLIQVWSNTDRSPGPESGAGHRLRQHGVCSGKPCSGDAAALAALGNPRRSTAWKGCATPNTGRMPVLRMGETPMSRGRPGHGSFAG